MDLQCLNSDTSWGIDTLKVPFRRVLPHELKLTLRAKERQEARCNGGLTVRVEGVN